MRRAARSAALAGAMAGLAPLVGALLGCGGGRVPPTTVWRLRPVSAADGGSAAAAQEAAGLRIGLGRFSSLAELRTTSVVRRSRDGREVQRYPHEEWADYPDRMLEELTIEALSRQEGVGVVVRTPPARGLHGVLACRLADFSEWSDAERPRVRIALSWRVEDPADQSVLGGGLIREEADVTDRSVGGVVDAFERAARAAAARLAAEAVTACATP